MALIISLIAHPDHPVLTPTVLNQACALLNDQPPRILAEHIAAEFEISNLPHTQQKSLSQKFTEIFANIPIDINIIPANNRLKKLLVADMDSTMIEQECIDELAAYAGKYDEIAAITERAMQGELDFEAALQERVSMLAGLPADIIDETFKKNISYTSGGLILIQTMKKHGAYTALVSGGFTAFTERVARGLGFDHHEANQLDFYDHKLSGRVKHPILGRVAKAHALQKLCDDRKIPQNQTLAVGDGANDLDMLAIADYGVAFHAKKATAQAAKISINHADLTALLYLQGIAQKDHHRV